MSTIIIYGQIYVNIKTFFYKTKIKKHIMNIQIYFVISIIHIYMIYYIRQNLAPLEKKQHHYRICLEAKQENGRNH